MTAKPTSVKLIAQKADTERGEGKPDQVKVYLQQADVPAYSLEQALRVPLAIAANYARKPTPTLRVAAAMNLQPSSSPSTLLTGASIAYGLTGAGPPAPQLAITPLRMRTVPPIKAGDGSVSPRAAPL